MCYLTKVPHNILVISVMLFEPVLVEVMMQKNQMHIVSLKGTKNLKQSCVCFFLFFFIMA